MLSFFIRTCISMQIPCIFLQLQSQWGELNDVGTQPCIRIMSRKVLIRSDLKQHDKNEEKHVDTPVRKSLKLHSVICINHESIQG